VVRNLKIGGKRADQKRDIARREIDNQSRRGIKKLAGKSVMAKEPCHRARRESARRKDRNDWVSEDGEVFNKKKIKNEKGVGRGQRVK